MKIAYIDSQNIKMWIKEVWFDVDWDKLYSYLKTKYKIDVIKFFVWYLDQNKDRYDELKNIWYNVIFKQTYQYDGKIKWNVDTLIMLHGIKDCDNWDLCMWMLLSGDWDFEVLVNYWKTNKKDFLVLVPNIKKKAKILYETAGENRIINMEDLKHIIWK